MRRVFNTRTSALEVGHRLREEFSDINRSSEQLPTARRLVPKRKLVGAARRERSGVGLDLDYCDRRSGRATFTGSDELVGESLPMPNEPFLFVPQQFRRFELT